jgi:hypothetical protein
VSPRPYWRGYLKLSLVSCPIALHAACASSERISFRQINRKTGNRLRQQLIDEETRDPIDAHDKARGYEIGKGQFLLVEDEELEAIEIESTHTIDMCYACGIRILVSYNQGLMRDMLPTGHGREAYGKRTAPRWSTSPSAKPAGLSRGWRHAGDLICERGHQNVASRPVVVKFGPPPAAVVNPSDGRRRGHQPPGFGQ